MEPTQQEKRKLLVMCTVPLWSYIHTVLPVPVLIKAENRNQSFY